MSHFFTIVILPKASLGIKSEVTKLLAPFDEELEYERKRKIKLENDIEEDDIEKDVENIAKWDWWRIGGRWDGEIKGEQITDEEDKGFNFGSQHESLERNTTTTDFLLKNKIIPFAIVTPDGKWHEKGNMGWWCLVTDEKEQISWDEEALEIYKFWEGYIAVGCDLHI